MDDIKISVGNRFKEERKRLNYSHSYVGEAAGQATRYTVMNWENGKNTPSAESLIMLASVGFDMVYILTGIRSQPVEDTLTRGERVVLDHYRHTNAEGQKIIEQTAFFAAESAAKAAGKKKA